MTPFYQTVPHDPPHSYGDCHRTAIACILDISPHTIPNMAGKLPAKKWYAAMNEHLATLGYQVATISYTSRFSREQLMSYMNVLNPTVHYILVGLTDKNVPHVVVCKGAKVVHDTNAGKPGVVKPMYDKDCDDYFWCINLLVKA